MSAHVRGGLVQRSHPQHLTSARRILPGHGECLRVDRAWCSGRGTRSVMRLVRGLVPLEPPSWRACWLESGRLLPRVFPDHEAVGLARLQNDLLLALTARHTGSLFATADAHFAALRRHVSFTVKVLSATY